MYTLAHGKLDLSVLWNWKRRKRSNKELRTSTRYRSHSVANPFLLDVFYVLFCSPCSVRVLSWFCVVACIRAYTHTHTYGHIFSSLHLQIQIVWTLAHLQIRENQLRARSLIFLDAFTTIHTAILIYLDSHFYIISLSLPTATKRISFRVQNIFAIKKICNWIYLRVRETSTTIIQLKKNCGELADACAHTHTHTH